MKPFNLSFAFTVTLLLAAGTAMAIQTNAVNRLPSCCQETEAPARFTDRSLYQVDSIWTTDAGKKIKLGDLAGPPQVVAMFFANCTYACPIIVHDMKGIEAALPPGLRSRVGFTLVSFDAKHDTPAALGEYRRTRELPAENWTLLHGEPDDILELAALLGVRYKQGADGQFVHSNVITLLNANGEIVYQQIGLNTDPQEMVHRIEQLSSGPANNPQISNLKTGS